MEQELQRQIAKNETVFREVNERLKAGHWPGDEGVAIGFRCECGHLGCTRMIDLSPAQYEQVRAHARRFLIAVDHDLPEAEAVVERHERYVVVEKRGEAGELAEATDPRD